MEQKKVDLNGIVARARKYWVHPITRSIDMDAAVADVVDAVREARLVRAQLAALLNGLGVVIQDTSVWTDRPEAWTALGRKLAFDMTQDQAN